jgi:hypothetical protein
MHFRYIYKKRCSALSLCSRCTGAQRRSRRDVRLCMFVCECEQAPRYTKEMRACSRGDEREFHFCLLLESGKWLVNFVRLTGADGCIHFFVLLF